MADKQTRRTISFNRVLFELIHDVAAREGKSASQWVSEVVVKKLKRAGVEVPALFFDGPSPNGRTNHMGATVTSESGRVAADAVQEPSKAGRSWRKREREVRAANLHRVDPAEPVDHGYVRSSS